MMMHVFTKLGKLHCVNINKCTPITQSSFCVDCDNRDLEILKHGEPCCIILMNEETETTFFNCTIEGNTIHYANAIGKSNK